MIDLSPDNITHDLALIKGDYIGNAFMTSTCDRATILIGNLLTKNAEKSATITRLLVALCRNVKMTPADVREQAISFAYGNLAIDNPLVTREMVADAYDRVEEEKKNGPR